MDTPLTSDHLLHEIPFSFRISSSLSRYIRKNLLSVRNFADVDENLRSVSANVLIDLRSLSLYNHINAEILQRRELKQ
jgi:hypothetical protein